MRHSTLTKPGFGFIFAMLWAVVLSLCAGNVQTARAQFALPGMYALKVYHVNSFFYPYVQVYFRTFDKDGLPLVNLNERNIGLMVKGRSYDPMKRQYMVQNLRQRKEPVRTVIVLDASKSMAGLPFESALTACARFIDSKRPQDQVMILAIRDTADGYEIVSEYERDPGALGRRLADVKCDGMKTRLYDTIGAAMQACAVTPQGSVDPEGADYVASCSIVVLSDGKDEGSALSREELNTRIAGLSIPIPIYSLAYTKINPEYFKNLESISKNSFGKYYLIGEAYEKMQRTLEEIQYIIQGDYVVTFKAFTPVDGEKHSFKLGIEYPSGSGKFMYDSGYFEAIEPPPAPQILQAIERLDAVIPRLPEGGHPYFDPTPQAHSSSSPQ
ncbi:MAG: VWA domain-containing protein [Desulfacinum sp.]|nr:VWA domain-containing protein [Desulfacinum sp.]